MAKSAICSVPPDFYERVFGGGEPPPPSPLTGGAGYVNSFSHLISVYRFRVKWFYLFKLM